MVNAGNIWNIKINNTYQNYEILHTESEIKKKKMWKIIRKK